MTTAQGGQDWRLVGPRATRVLCLRHTGPYSRRLDTWRELTAMVFEQGLSGPGTRAIGILHDDPMLVPGDRARYDVCLSLSTESPLTWPTIEKLCSTDGVRLETVMGDGPMLRLTTPWSPGELLPPHLFARPPVFEVYRRSPVFLQPFAPPVEYLLLLQRQSSRSANGQHASTSIRGSFG
ncbi:MAG: GyrI-like domain-containing protein [Pseudonocardiaceae bacterium]